MSDRQQRLKDTEPQADMEDSATRGLAFMLQIQYAVDKGWSDSDAEWDSETSVDGQEEFRDSSSDQDSSGDSSEPHVSDSTEGNQQPEEDVSLSQVRCAGLRRLLKRKSKRHTNFSNIISKALFKFAERGLHEEAKVLLEFEADLDYTDTETGYTPLHAAVERGDAKMVEILMMCDASASETYGETDETPLVMACLSGELECVRMMLEHGADVNGEDDDGKTPLMRLVEEKGSFQVMELLLEKGADVNSDLLEPVLYELFECSQEPIRYGVEAVRLLLRHGFKPQCCSQQSLLKLSLTAFDRLFSLASLLCEREDTLEPDHDECWSRLDVLREALTDALRGRSEAEARALVDKANVLLDLPIVHPSPLRFTLRPVRRPTGAGSGHRGAEWAVDTEPARESGRPRRGRKRRISEAVLL
uniref:Uncharacterized protein n=1 Tax=Neogobius melanostomus TaxID=47308 RepID=A0A8C6TQK6_9GOBI